MAEQSDNSGVASTGTAGYLCINCQQWVNAGQYHDCTGTTPNPYPDYTYSWPPQSSWYTTTWFICPNCKGGFSSWDIDSKCPFCGMKNGEYEKNE